jgi:hypothetical protein
LSYGLLYPEPVKPRTVLLDLAAAEPRAAARAARNGGGERYRVVLEAGELVLLRRDDGGAGPRVLMAGELVSASTVLDVINTVAASRWAGTLQVLGDGARRVLGFARGVLRHAQSDHPEDRLDKILARQGVLSPAQVEAVVREGRPDQRLGELLVERRLISRPELFTHLRRQMEEILLAAVLVDRGAYVFTVDDEGEEAPAATAHIPVQHLLLTAAERVDQLSRYRRLVPDPALCPEVEPGVEVTRLDPRAQLVLGYCNGVRSVAEIAAETWLGRYETTEVVYRLARDRCVRLREPQPTPLQLAARLVEPFNDLLREIHVALDRWGDRERARRDLAAWAAGDAERQLLAASLDGDGAVDADAVAQGLVENRSETRLEDLRHALHEMTSYALFNVSLWLPREVERELARHVEEGLRRA